MATSQPDLSYDANHYKKWVLLAWRTWLQGLVLLLVVLLVLDFSRRRDEYEEDASGPCRTVTVQTPPPQRS